MTIFTDPTMDAAISQWEKGDAVKNQHMDTFKDNRDEIFALKVRADVKLFYILHFFFQSGPSLTPMVTPDKLKDPTGSTFVETYEDKLRVIGLKRSVTTAASSVLTKVQNAINSAQGDSKITTESIAQELRNMRGSLEKLKGKTDGPFDTVSIDSMIGSINTLIGEGNTTGGLLKQINDMGGFAEVAKKAQTAGDTSGAASLLKKVTDNTGTVGTSLNTISSVQTTQTNMIAGDLQTANSVLKMLISWMSESIKSAKGQPVV